jgi:hypothetical protein
MKSLAKNKSFVLSTVAFTCVTYCAGAMMWWGPNFAFAGEFFNGKQMLSFIATWICDSGKNTSPISVGI